MLQDEVKVTNVVTSHHAWPEDPKLTAANTGAELAEHLVLLKLGHWAHEPL